MATSLKNNPTCNRSFYPQVGSQKDQINESFADWFSAEVIAQSPDDITKDLRSDLCREKELTQGSSYVSNIKRLQAIYLSQVKIQKMLKLPETGFKYCTL